mgnify:CR=1 FL=1
MAQIRIDTARVGEVGQRFGREADRLAEIGHELQGAIHHLDTWAWDGRSRARAEPLLARVRPESARLAEGLNDLGRKLDRVAAAFEHEDATAAGNLAGMPWVEFGTVGLSVAMPAFPTPPPADRGAGPYGSEDPGLDDRAWEQALYAGAAAFEALGLVNAARHMRHYLDGSGDPLTLDPELVLRDLPGFREAAENERDRFFREIQATMAQDYQGQAFSRGFTSDWLGFYALPGDSADWFYSMGGFSYAFTAVATVLPPTTPDALPTVEIAYQMHIYDRYNWDQDKGVRIAGVVPIPDDSMGELHRAGLAQEYDIRGSTSTTTVSAPLGS